MFQRKPQSGEFSTVMDIHQSMRPISIFIVLSLILCVTSCDTPITPLNEAPGPEFYSLFNGSDMSGWKLGVEPEESSWSAVDGVIHCKGEPRTPYLILTEKDYENFEFYAELKVSKGCNSGIFFHQGE